MNDDTRLTRRRMLAGAGTLGAIGAAGGASAVLIEPAVAYPDTLRIDEGTGAPLQIGWREAYNGRVLEDALDSGRRPIVTLGNVLPGDTGSVALRVRLADDSEGDPGPSRIVFSLSLLGSAENGISEPEAAAADRSTAASELGTAIDTRLWYDVGAFGISQAGGCNVSREPGESAIASGPLAAVADELDDGIVLRPGGSGGDCFGPDDVLCLGVRWSIPSSVGNVVQTDSVRFALTFRTERCRP